MEEQQEPREHGQNAQTSVRHNESISIVRNDNVYDVELITVTSIDNLPLGDLEKRHWMAPLYPMDSFLIHVIKKFHLQSLTISVSSSSTNQRRGFPMGTAVKFHTRAENGTNGSSHQHHHDMDQSDDLNMEYDLMRILSQKNMLCETAQLEPFHSNRQLRAVPLGGDGSKIIMIPNDAYSLCHSQAILDQVISAAPCRNTFGIYSQQILPLQQNNLNKIDILNKSSWVEVKVMEHGKIEIQRGLRFGRIITKMNEMPVSLAEILGGNGGFLHHCPLADSSTLTIHEENIGIVTYDFMKAPLDMQKVLQIQNEKGNENNLHIQKSVMRMNGISNKGKLSTRVYIGSIKDQGNSKCEADSIDVHVMETYPSFISPIYHSLNLLLVQGPGAGEENFDLATAISKETNFTMTQLSLKDMKHTFSIHSEGYSTISINASMQQDSSLYIQLDYNPKYLGFESFSSDPNRGFDLFPSIATFTCNTDGISLSDTYFSNSLIIMPPVPDLSMPFNVISLYSTFCALIIGTIINLVIKKSREKVRDLLNGKVSKSKKDLFNEKLQQFLVLLGVKKTQDTCLDEGTIKEKFD